MEQLFKGYSALHWPLQTLPALEDFQRRQGHTVQLNLPLDLALGPPLPLTLWALVTTARYSLPGTQQQLRKSLLAE